jgi:holo-[acyl-carrier-protein] synthase
MIEGLGIDIVQIDKIKKILDSTRGSRFLKRIFCEEEIEYAINKKRPHDHFAGFFAVKESFLKALGSGLRKSIKLKEIEISHDAIGVPVLKTTSIISDNLKEILEKKKIHISLSHHEGYAVGVVIITRL